MNTNERTYTAFFEGSEVRLRRDTDGALLRPVMYDGELYLSQHHLVVALVKEGGSPSQGDVSRAARNGRLFNGKVLRHASMSEVLTTPNVTRDEKLDRAAKPKKPKKRKRRHSNHREIERRVLDFFWSSEHGKTGRWFTKTEVRENVIGNGSDIKNAIDRLVESGYLELSKPTRYGKLRAAHIKDGLPFGVSTKMREATAPRSEVVADDDAVRFHSDGRREIVNPLDEVERRDPLDIGSMPRENVDVIGTLATVATDKPVSVTVLPGVVVKVVLTGKAKDDALIGVARLLGGAS